MADLEKTLARISSDVYRIITYMILYWFILYMFSNTEGRQEQLRPSDNKHIGGKFEWNPQANINWMRDNLVFGHLEASTSSCGWLLWARVSCINVRSVQLHVPQTHCSDGSLGPLCLPLSPRCWCPRIILALLPTDALHSPGKRVFNSTAYITNQSCFSGTCTNCIHALAIVSM